MLGKDSLKGVVIEVTLVQERTENGCQFRDRSGLLGGPTCFPPLPEYNAPKGLRQARLVPHGNFP